MTGCFGVYRGHDGKLNPMSKDAGKRCQAKNSIKSLQNFSESHLGVTGISGVGKHLATIPINTVDGSEIRRSPVEVGSLYSHYIRGILAPSKRWLVVWDF